MYDYIDHIERGRALAEARDALQHGGHPGGDVEALLQVGTHFTGMWRCNRIKFCVTIDTATMHPLCLFNAVIATVSSYKYHFMRCLFALTYIRRIR